MAKTPKTVKFTGEIFDTQKIAKLAGLKLSQEESKRERETNKSFRTKTFVII